MKVLTCVEAPSGKVFGLKVSDKQFVWELKLLLKEMNNYSCPAKDIVLYRARIHGDWLKHTNANLTQIKDRTDVVPAQVKYFSYNRMDETLFVGNMRFGFPEEGLAKENDIHLYVDLPDTKCQCKAPDRNPMANLPPYLNARLAFQRRHCAIVLHREEDYSHLHEVRKAINKEIRQKK